MPFCPTYNGLGKKKQSELCIDCNGKGTIDQNTLNFIEYCQNRTKIQKEIARLEKETMEPVDQLT